MKILIALLAFATVANAATIKEARQQAPAVVAQDDIRFLAWLGEPVEFKEVITPAVTNIVDNSEQYGWWWFVAGRVQAYGATVPVSRYTLGQAMDKAATEAVNAGKVSAAMDVLKDANWLLVAWDVLKADQQDAEFWLKPPLESITTIISEVVEKVPTKVQWQKSGLSKSPTPQDVKDAQK